MINKTYDQQIWGWLEANRDRILAEWMELVRIPSVQSPAQPKAPFGPDCARAVKTAASFFADRGIPVRVNEEGGYALADLGSEGKTIGLFGHSDVVPAGDGWQFTQPFEPVIREGMLIGRGASDNKSGVMASLCVLAMIKELGLPVKNTLRAFIGSNEESGMGDITAFKQQEQLPDISLIPDGHFPCSLGEKGILRMWAACDSTLTAIRDIRGGNAFNIVLDHVDTVLEPNAALAEELAEKCAEDPAHYTLKTEADGSVLLCVEGVAKHAGSPDGSLNATWLTAKLLATCSHLPASDRKILQTVADFLSSPWGEGMDLAHRDPEFGPLTAVNGMVAMEEGYLKVALDIRYGTSLPHTELESKLYRLWQNAGWQIVHMNDRPGYSVDPASPVPEIARSICQELSGRQLSFYRMAGGTYGRYLPNAFCVGTYILSADRQTPGMVMPAGRGGAHQRDESIDIESFFLAVRILTHIVLACDEVLS